MFFTYHPSACLRDSKNVAPTRRHFELLRTYLEAGLLPQLETPPPVEIAPVISGTETIAIDIETYGVLKGYSQTQFHPDLSTRIDKIPVPDQIVTASMAWRDTKGAVHTGIYVWRNPRHREIFFENLCRVAHGGHNVVGMNVVFDLLYLSRHDSRLSKWMDAFWCKDIAIWSFLLDDQQPERSLKSIAPLLNVTRYDVTAKTQFNNAMDPKLWAYNCQDTFATLRCNEILEERMTELGLLEDSATWWTRVLEECFHMSNVGVTFNLPDLITARNLLGEKLETLQNDASLRGLTLKGEGSQKSIQDVLDKSAQHLPKTLSKDLEITEKTHRISACDKNRTLLLSSTTLPEDLRTSLHQLDTFVRARKMLTSALVPLVDKWCSPTGRVSPNWYSIPTHVKDDTGDSGGTRQARLTCKNPALQTLPPPVRNLQISRWEGGTILSVDASQLELRVGAMISSDPVMCEEYEKDIDRHMDRANELFGLDDILCPVGEWIKLCQSFCKMSPNLDIRDGLDSYLLSPNPDYEATVKDWLRQAGKTINFLIQFRGGAYKAQKTLQSDIGMFIELPRLQNIIRKTYDRYPVFEKWQDDRIQLVRDTGFLRLWNGLRRTFYNPHIPFAGDAVNFEDLIPQIVNFEIQSYAAMLTLGAAITMRRSIVSSDSNPLKPLPLITWNQFDSVFLDVPPGLGIGYLTTLKDVIHNSFKFPDFYQDFMNVCRDQDIARKVPLTCNIKRISGPELF